MSIAFQQLIAAFSNGSGNPSAAFTPLAAPDTLLCFDIEGGTANVPVFTSSNGGTWVNLLSAVNAGGQNCSIGYKLACAAGSQTITITDQAGAFPNGFPVEYSGVVSLSNGSTIGRATPGTGAGAIVGTSVNVPTGSVLVAICIDNSASTLTAFNGTSRGGGNLGGRQYLIADYAGADVPIQPLFTSTTGATDTFIVMQAVLSVVGASVATLAWLRA